MGHKSNIIQAVSSNHGELVSVVETRLSDSGGVDIIKCSIKQTYMTVLRRMIIT